MLSSYVYTWENHEYVITYYKNKFRSRSPPLRSVIFELGRKNQAGSRQFAESLNLPLEP